MHLSALPAPSKNPRLSNYLVKKSRVFKALQSHGVWKYWIPWLAITMLRVISSVRSPSLSAFWSTAVTPRNQLTLAAAGLLRKSRALDACTSSSCCSSLQRGHKSRPPRRGVRTPRIKDFNSAVLSTLSLMMIVIRSCQRSAAFSCTARPKSRLLCGTALQRWRTDYPSSS